MIVIDFPLLISDFLNVNANGASNFNETGLPCYRGFIKIQGCPTEICLTVPHYPDVKDATLSSPDVGLAAKIHSCHSQLVQAADESSEMTTFLKKAHQILKDTATVDETGRVADSGVPRWVSYLLEDLQSIGWNNISALSQDMSSITVQEVVSDHKHLLQVVVPPDYPRQQPTYEALLPVQLKITATSLTGVVAEWREQVQQLQQFWDVMQDLDRTAAVLDPPEPQLHHTHRRILLSNQVSVHLVVSPHSPHSPPQCQMIGSSRLTESLLTRLTESYHEWDGERSIVSNLEHLLQVAVVRRGTRHDAGNDEEDADGVADVCEAECVVCYSLHCGTELPDSICEHCQQAMHLTCLYTWLSGLAHSRQSMQYIFGECPYCTKPISCKVLT